MRIKILFLFAISLSAVWSEENHAQNPAGTYVHAENSPYKHEKILPPTAQHPGFMLAVQIKSGQYQACPAVFVGRKKDQCAIATSNTCLKPIKNRKGPLRVDFPVAANQFLQHGDSSIEAKVTTSKSNDVNNGILFLTVNNTFCNETNVPDQVILPIRKTSLKNNEKVRMGLVDTRATHTGRVQINRYSKKVKPSVWVKADLRKAINLGCIVSTTNNQGVAELAGFGSSSSASGGTTINTNQHLTWLQKQLENFNAN